LGQTDSPDPSGYSKKLRKRDPDLGKALQGGGQFVPPLAVEFSTTGGPQKMQCWNTEGIFRLIQSILNAKVSFSLRQRYLCDIKLHRRDSGNKKVARRASAFASTPGKGCVISLVPRQRHWSMKMDTVTVTLGELLVVPVARNDGTSMRFTQDIINKLPF
jgi:hypothetical protein